jgi:hypothetical protein
VKNIIKLEIAKNEKIEMILVQGIGPVRPGDSLYMDDKSVVDQFVIGNCKHGNKMICFFVMTQAEKTSDGKTLPHQNIVYEVEIINDHENVNYFV